MEYATNNQVLSEDESVWRNKEIHFRIDGIVIVFLTFFRRKAISFEKADKKSPTRGSWKSFRYDPWLKN